MKVSVNSLNAMLCEMMTMRRKKCVRRGNFWQLCCIRNGYGRRTKEYSKQEKKNHKYQFCNMKEESILSGALR